jgi:hypothetical protein
VNGNSKPQSAILCGLPLFHVGGALTQGLAPLSSGQRLVTRDTVAGRLSER